MFDYCFFFLCNLKAIQHSITCLLHIYQIPDVIQKSTPFFFSISVFKKTAYGTFEVILVVVFSISVFKKTAYGTWEVIVSAPQKSNEECDKEKYPSLPCFREVS